MENIENYFPETFPTNEGWKADCPYCGKTKRLYWNVEKNIGCCMTADCAWHYSRGGVTAYRLRALVKKEGIRYTQPTRIIERPKDLESKLPEEFKLLDELDASLRDSLYAYLNSRGILTKTLKRQQVGYCEQGSLWGYIIFPVFDSEGKVIYWQGRRFKDRKQKFFNPPASNKKEIFYQLGGSIQTKHLIVVESIFNALTLDTGRPFRRTAVIALLGKTLSEHQLDHIRSYDKYLRDVVLALDPDAMQDTIQIAKKLTDCGFIVRIARVPDGEDLNSLGRGRA